MSPVRFAPGGRFASSKFQLSWQRSVGARALDRFRLNREALELCFVGRIFLRKAGVPENAPG
jgi:hypothetical protein